MEGEAALTTRDGTLADPGDGAASDPPESTASAPPSGPPTGGPQNEGRSIGRSRSGVKGPACSPAQQAYFDALHGEAMRSYAVAKQARRKGKDPILEVEILPAEDLAARVEAQVGPEGVAEKIRAATKELGNRELVALRVASDVAAELQKAGEKREKILDQAVRTGLSILTEGVLVAPLEGIAEVKIGGNHDGTDYVDLYFAGPIRAAGGTGQAMSVLIADVVRRTLGIGTYVPTDAEVERYKEEIPAYKAAANLQYTPTSDEIERIARNCPVCINGEGTEQEEVTGNRDLPRVESNRLRGGACLVMAEGLVLKAPKILKHVEKLGLEGWSFLETFMKKGKNDDDGDERDGGGIPEIPPNPKFVRDIIAGRPVFGHPSRPGAFRLRYGRARTAGLAANAIHPATMALVDDFLAVGTQLKVERPGKGTLATPCDELDGPTVLLHNGDVVRLRDMAHVKELRPAVAEILDLGEILIPFGEFAENNALLPHSSWVREWWLQEHQAKTGQEEDPAPPGTHGIRLVRLAEETGVPLHPDGTLLWHDVDLPAIRALGEVVLHGGAWDEGTRSLSLPTGDHKATLEALLCLHTVRDGRIHVADPLAYPLLRCLGLDLAEGRITDTPRRRVLYDPCLEAPMGPYPVVEVVSRLAGFPVMPRAPCRVGGRMGRPEKADVRKMKPPPHGLVPIGQAGGNQRLVKEAAVHGTVEVEVGERRCTACGKKHWRTFCDCGGHTEPSGRPPSRDGGFQERGCTRVPLKEELERAKRVLGMNRLPDIKGVVGVVNKDRVPEPVEKAVLRAKYQLWTFKDGTVRYDMTDVPITHFRPKEIHAPVEKLRAMGYTHDIHGAALERDDQVLELRVQDIIVSDGCMDYFLRTTQFLDELLERFYGLKPFYGCKSKEDVLGHLAIGLAPHTSGGVLCRIIGWTTAQVHFGHPYFHAAKRRNCMPGDAEVLVLNSPRPVRRTLAALFDAADGPVETVDGTGTQAVVADGLRVFAADPQTGVIAPRAVTRIYRVPAPRHLVSLRLKSGRTLRVSPHHRLEVFDGGLVKRKAVQVQAGDALPFATRIPFDPVAPSDTLDLWETLRNHPLDGVMVRGARSWLQDGIKAHGLAVLADTAGTTAKALDRYRRRDSIPEPVARLLEPVLGALPDCRLAVARDSVKMPRYIPIGTLAYLIGLYIAVGCARSGAVHRLDFAVTETALQGHILEGLRRLGLSPRRTATRITVNGRLVHHIFTRVWGLGTTAHDKRIPAWAQERPADWRADLLAGIFDGHGSVETGRGHVAYHTASHGLLRDLQVQLATFGIATRIARDERSMEDAVVDHARRTGRSPGARAGWGLYLCSDDAARFSELIGFRLPRKQQALADAVQHVQGSPLPRFGDLALDEVVATEPAPFDGAWLYDLEVEGHHNFLVEDMVLVSNCDGDEDAVMLLMDGLLNFSRKYVPDKRGGLMDLPLVLTTRLDPNEVDKEAHNVDTLFRYPLEFYRATTRHAHPKEVSRFMGLVEERIGTPAQYEGFGFTHDTTDIAEGPAASAYKVLDTTKEKLTAQMELARKIRAVDEPDVGAKVIGTHLLPDIMGNLKAFSKQKVRCVQCNTKYRRMPLKGTCLKCGNPKLTLTVHEASVRKYLDVCKEIADRYHIDAYTRQRIHLLEQSVDSLFNNDKVRKAKLTDFF